MIGYRRKLHNDLFKAFLNIFNRSTAVGRARSLKVEEMYLLELRNWATILEETKFILRQSFWTTKQQ